MTYSHPTTEGLNLEIGGIYSYTNSLGYTTTLKIVRITGKSIFVNRCDKAGNFFNTEFREGVTTFKKYKKVN